jgi:DNA-binding beta-propeller fold protein YncE
MKKFTYAALFLAAGLLTTTPAFAQLKLVQRLEFPGNITGKFDHFGVDLEHGRLYATPESAKSVEVFDIRSGKHLGAIHGIGEAHSMVYRQDLNKLYVVDGGGEEGEAGSLKVVDATSYKIEKSVSLLTDADNIGYDPKTRRAYVTNGGKDAKLDYVMITEIDTDSGEKVGEVKVGGDTLEAMALEPGTRRMFINNSATNAVEVIDWDQHKIVETWPVTTAKMNVAMALDEANHRLFLGCRDGHIVVMDSKSGKELQTLPITKGKTDDMVFDPTAKRIYVATAGAVDTYSQIDADHYKLLQTVQTSAGAKTARLVPEIHRYFVAAPPDGARKAEILVYEVR